MSERFAIKCQWLPREHGDAVERATFAEVGIYLNGVCLTELNDLVAKSVRQNARLSAYDLARWFAANWWRLRWESEPTPKDHSWRMSHNVGAAGGGYVWPDLELCSDGGKVMCRARPTTAGNSQSIEYIKNLDLQTTSHQFERGIDEFVGAVVARLVAESVNETSLKPLWDEVLAERKDPKRHAWRKIEALMSFDPDDAPEGLVDDLLQEARTLGTSAIEEVAADSKESALSNLQAIVTETKKRVTQVRIQAPDKLRERIWQETGTPGLQWQRAAEAAAIARQEWAVGEGPISNRALSDLFQFPEESIEQQDGDGPLPVAFRGENGSDEIGVFLKKKHPHARRFALSRLIADHLISEPNERLLPATAAKTERQKYQRAFAQEFLCPFDQLRDFLPSTSLNEEHFEDAAEYFHVSTFVVTSVLVNKGVIDRDNLPNLA